MSELISIIVPVYKVEKYLDRCVDSLVKQTYKNLEIILVDDGSPDNCPNMCDEWAKKDSRIKVIHKENGGVSSARNLGLENAKGDYVGFVDSDDWCDLTMYEKLYNTLKQNNADIVMSGVNYAYDDRVLKLVEVDYKPNLTPKEILNSNIKFGMKKEADKIISNPIYPSIWRMLYKKSLIKDIKFKNLTHGEDTLFIMDVFTRVKNVVCVNDPLYYYYQRENSAVRTVSEGKKHAMIAFPELTQKALNEIYKEDEQKLAWDFSMYFSAVQTSYMHGEEKFIKQNLDKFNYTKKGYQIYKKNNRDFKVKISAFLIYHRWFWLFKLMLKICGKIKK